MFYIIQFDIFLFLFIDCLFYRFEKYLSFIIFLYNRKQIPNISFHILLYNFESIFQFFNRRIHRIFD